MRSPGSIARASALQHVVLPALVAPETTMFQPARTIACRKAHPAGSRPNASRGTARAGPGPGRRRPARRARRPRLPPRAAAPRRAASPRGARATLAAPTTTDRTAPRATADAASHGGRWTSCGALAVDAPDAHECVPEGAGKTLRHARRQHTGVDCARDRGARVDG